MQTILGGRGMGAASFVADGSNASPAGARCSHWRTRSMASAPPAIADSTSSKPAPRMPVTRPSARTPGSKRLSFSNVTNRNSESPLLSVSFGLAAGPVRHRIEHRADNQRHGDDSFRFGRRHRGRIRDLLHRRISGRALRGTGPAHRAREAFQTFPPDGGNREVHQGAGSQRGFLFGVHVLFAGHPHRPVYADLRGKRHGGLAGPRAGAVPQQPPDPPARRIQGQPRRPDVDSGGGALTWTSARITPSSRLPSPRN